MTRAPMLTAMLAIATIAPVAAQGDIEYDDYRLANGLRVILVEDHSVPIVTIDLWFNVGSVHEEMNRSGFAHLFEHMMFEGSANVAKDEFDAHISRAGGSLNGTTNEDRTAYFETLPSNRLNLGLWLEADRMRSLAITPENFENQRNAVQEERRMRVDNQPYAGAITEGLTQMWNAESCFGYSHSVIGSMDDLNAARVEDVQAFFDMYYAPGNATLTLVGDFDPRDAKRLIDEYFGDIPAGATPPTATCDWSVGTEAEEITWEDPLANLPLVLASYRIPSHADDDTRALQLLNSILTSGESSRLNMSMVRGTKSAAQAGGIFDSRRRAGAVTFLGIANQGVEATVLRDEIHAEVTRVLAQGVTEEELERVKAAYRSGDIFGRQTTMSVAENVQHVVHFHDSMDDLNSDLDKYLAVTTADILRVARKYLNPENSYTMLVVPAGTARAVVP